MSDPDGTPQQLRHWVADRLRADILEGRLRPGEWLRQEHAARRLGVSQMPVREAFKQLAAEGLLELVPYRGARVVSLSVEDVEDLYITRATIESRAARWAAERITDEEIAELAGLHERMVACAMPDQLPAYRELNRRFHAIVFHASHRYYLSRTLGQLWAAFPTMLWSSIPQIADESVPDRELDDAAEHAQILDALRARDADRAEAAVRRHIEAAATALLAALRERR